MKIEFTEEEQIILAVLKKHPHHSNDWLSIDCHMSPSALRKHVQRIYEKLGIHRTGQTKEREVIGNAKGGRMAIYVIYKQYNDKDGAEAVPLGYVTDIKQAHNLWHDEIRKHLVEQGWIDDSIQERAFDYHVTKWGDDRYEQENEDESLEEFLDTLDWIEEQNDCFEAHENGIPIIELMQVEEYG